MSQNVTVAGASYQNVPSVILPKTGGGSASFTDVTDTTAAASDVASGKYFYTAEGVRTQGTSSGGGDNWSFMGKNPYKLQDWAETITFNELGVGSWTYSTTASNLRASQSLSPTFTLDFANYDYYIYTKVYVKFAYKSGWTQKSAMLEFAMEGKYGIVGTYGTIAAAQSETPDTVSSKTYGSSYAAYYKNSSGNKQFGNGTYYGVYSTSIVQQSGTGAYPNTVYTFKTPVISIRGSSTYFSSTALSNIDLNNSKYYLHMELWRADYDSTITGEGYRNIVTMLNDHAIN